MTSVLRRIAAVVLVVPIAGCSWFSWFSRKPPVAPAAAPVSSASPADPIPVAPLASARAACANYDALIRESPFPRAAIIRGIDAGTASVLFEVDGTKVTVLSVVSSAPPFGDAAADTARELRCTVDHPTRFSIAFEWRTVR